MQQEVIDLTTTTKRATKRKAEASDQQQAKRRRTMVESEMPPLTMLTVAGEATNDPFFPDTNEFQDVFVKYKNHCTNALIIEALALPEDQSSIETRLVILSAIWERRKKYPDFNTLWLQVYSLLMVQVSYNPPVSAQLKKEGFKRLEKIAELCTPKHIVSLFTSPVMNEKNVKELLRKVDKWVYIAYELRIEWYSMKKFKEIGDEQRYVTFSKGYKRFERSLLRLSRYLLMQAKKFHMRDVGKSLQHHVILLLTIKDVRKLQGYLNAMQIHHARQCGAKIQTKVLQKYLEDVGKINKALSKNGEWNKLKLKFNVEYCSQIANLSLIYF